MDLFVEKRLSAKGAEYIRLYVHNDVLGDINVSFDTNTICDILDIKKSYLLSIDRDCPVCVGSIELKDGAI